MDRRTTKVLCCLAGLGIFILLAACSKAPSTGDLVDDGPGGSGIRSASATHVHTGLDLIYRDGHALFEGRSIGLVVHGPSMTRDGVHAIDVFLQRGYDVRRLFSPEHGLRGSAAAGEKVADGIDPDSGLPIVSFYGPRRRPDPEHLADLDVLVIDLQDVGVRFYTYVSTMLLSAEAGLAAGLDVVVLDRPNPLGGVETSGPMRDVSVKLSMVSRAPGVLVHGLTMGELARVMFPRARAVEVASTGRIYVVPVEGWQRSQRWKDQTLPWRNPSPNLRSADAARLYPATAMLEGTNVLEGRGTADPFLTIGAPWFSQELLKGLQGVFAEFGVQATPIEFTPKGSPAAPHPKYEDELCQGLSLVAGGGSIDQYALGLRVLERLSQEDEFELLRDGKSLTWLLGTPAATAVLTGALDIEEHLAAVASENATWREQRAAAVLYE